MRLTTLCYIEHDGKYLMLLRNVKKNDGSLNKWIGVGGKMEEGESPDECAKREIYEETGLIPKDLTPRGIVTFISDTWEDEYMFLYSVSEFSGELIECNEGELHWIDKDKLFDLNLWDGDRIFLRMLMENEPYFEMKLCYKGDRLSRCVINGKERELFDICNSDGSFAGYVAERSFAHSVGLWHQTVHIWIFRQSEDGRLEVLLQKRAACKDSFPGCYDISSAGHISAGDNVLDSAVRELHEELGLKICQSDLEPAGFFVVELDDVFHGKRFIDREISNLFIYRKALDTASLVLQEEEVESVMWMDFDECRRAVAADSFKHCIYTEELDMLADAIHLSK